MIEKQIKEAMAAAGISAPASIDMNGGLHRFDTDEKRGKTGWYIFFGDGVPAGRFGCWRSGVEQSWRSDIGRPLTAIESMINSKRTAEAKRQRDIERETRHADASECAQSIWDSCAEVAAHPYLHKKQIKANGARLAPDGRLVVPVLAADNTIQSLQYIDAGGGKMFLKNGKTTGGHYILGNLGAGVVYIAEGFATAATVHEVTGAACVVAFSGHNLASVAQTITGSLGATRDIVIVADNDNGGQGQRYAIAAGEASGCRIVTPPETGDANDYHKNGGDLLALLAPPKTSWLIPVSEFCKQPAPIGWLVKNWLQSDALIMIHGPSGGGKTFVVLDWALRVASGVPEWCGVRVNHGPVVYLAGEGHHGLKGRICAWREKNDVEPKNLWLSSGGCDLNTPEGYTRVVSEVKELKDSPKIIIVDTLHRFLHGDENSAQDAKTMLDACAGLMHEFGCSVILVHHTGTGGTDRARGSTAWRGGLDIEIGITPGENGGPIKISQHKSKDSEQAKDVYVSLESVLIPGWVDDEGGPVSSAVIVPAEAPERKKQDTAQHMKTFSNAWFASGCEVRDKRPYVSKSALRNKLETDGKSERTVKNDLNPSYNEKLIGFLILNKYITCYEHGWMVSNDTEASAMMVSRLER